VRRRAVVEAEAYLRLLEIAGDGSIKVDEAAKRRWHIVVLPCSRLALSIISLC
jgi:hypothetical protein